MHAVVVQVTIHDFDRARETLTSEIVPQVSQAPGFVTGYWLRSEDNRGLSVIVLESEEAAQAVKQMIESNAPNNDAVSLESAEVREVVAHA
jgi:heme-degrading monooxygenase HmoA